MNLNPKFQLPLSIDEILNPLNELNELEKLEPWRKHDYKFFAFCLAGIRQYYTDVEDHPNDLFNALSEDYEMFLSSYYISEDSWESFERQVKEYFLNLID